MKFSIGKLLIMLITLFGLHSCVISEAPKSKNNSLHVYYDSFVKEDKKWIRGFERKHHINVIIHLTDFQEVRAEIMHHQYDGKMDVLFVQTDSIKKFIRSKKESFNNLDQSLYDGLPKQFTNQHHKWLAICHNPLLLSIKKDTNSNCLPFNFLKWNVKNEGKKPLFDESDFNNEQIYSLKNSKRTSFIYNKKAEINYSQKLIPLTKAIQHPTKDCYYYLVERRNYFTQTFWVVNPRYSRNQKNAEMFLKFLKMKHSVIAKNRNQLPTFKENPQNNQNLPINIH